jgi:hypothetical protein
MFMKNIHKIKDKIPKALYNRMLHILAYSLAPGAMGFIGLYFGLKLDRITGMTPNFSLVCLITGLALGYLGFVHEIKDDMKA